MRHMLAALFIPHAPALFGVSTLIIIIGAIILIAVVAAIIILVAFRNGSKAKQPINQGAPIADWQRQGQPTDNAWGQQPQPGAWGPPQQPQPNAWGAQGVPQQPQSNTWGAQGVPQQPQSNTWGAQGVPQQPQAPDGWGVQNVPPQQSQSNAWGAQGAPQQPPVPDSWGVQNAPPQQPQSNAWGSQAAWDGSPSSANNAWSQPQPQQQSQPAWGPPTTTPGSPQPGAAPYGGNQAWGSAQDPWAAPQAQQPQSPPQPAWQPQGFQSPPANTFPANNSAGQTWQQQGPPAGGSFGPVGAGQDSAGVYAGESDRTVLRNTGPQSRLGVVRVEEGKDPGRVYEVRKESLSIGRSRESDIFLEDLAVSRLHASIVNIGSGNYGLKDEGSANGTKVNGQLVPKNQTYPLNEGDKIQLGQTVLVFGKR